MLVDVGISEKDFDGFSKEEVVELFMALSVDLSEKSERTKKAFENPRFKDFVKKYAIMKIISHTHDDH